MGFSGTQGFTPLLSATWTKVALRIGAKAKPSTASVSSSFTTSVA